MFYAGWLCFPILDTWPYVGDIVLGPITNFFLVTRTIFSQCDPYVSPYVLVGPTTVGTLVGEAGLWPSFCQALSCAVATSLLVDGAKTQHDWLHSVWFLGLVLPLWCVGWVLVWLSAGPGRSQGLYWPTGGHAQVLGHLTVGLGGAWDWS